MAIRLICAITRYAWWVKSKFLGKKPIQLTVLLLLLGLSACSPLRLINLTVDKGDYAQTKNLSYGAHKLQKLDVYQPLTDCKKCPVLVWVHGGAWQSGNKDLYTFIGGAFTAAGMVVVIPDYRKYPDLFPDFMNDTASALRWVHDNIDQYGGDKNNLNIVGHSAGAHISLLLAFDTQYLQAAAVPLDAIKTVVGLAGLYDFLPLKSPVIKAIFSRARPLATSQPINFVNDTSPPILLATGLKDRRVDAKNSLRMAEAIKSSGGKAELILYPDLGHVTILLSLLKPLSGTSTVYQDVLNFLDTPAQAGPLIRD